MTRVSEDAPLCLGYERRGKGEPLLLIHGAGSYRRVWEPVLDRLAVEREVIAVDLPGHGDSPLMEKRTPPKPQNFARLMVAFLDEIGVEFAHVAGNSSGGWTALEMAKLGNASSVTALSPAGLWRGGTPRQVILMFRLSRVLARWLGRGAPALLATSLAEPVEPPDHQDDALATVVERRLELRVRLLATGDPLLKDPLAAGGRELPPLESGFCSLLLTLM